MGGEADASSPPPVSNPGSCTVRQRGLGLSVRRVRRSSAGNMKGAETLCRCCHCGTRCVSLQSIQTGGSAADRDSRIAAVNPVICCSPPSHTKHGPAHPPASGYATRKSPRTQRRAAGQSQVPCKLPSLSAAARGSAALRFHLRNVRMLDCDLRCRSVRTASNLSSHHRRAASDSDTLEVRQSGHGRVRRQHDSVPDGWRADARWVQSAEGTADKSGFPPARAPCPPISDL